MRSRIVKIFIGLTGMIAILVMLQEYRMTHGGSKLFNLTASKLLMKNPEEYIRKEDHMRRDDVIKDSDEMDEDDVDDRTPFHIVSGIKEEQQGDEDGVGEDLEEEGTVSKESEETPTHLGAMTDQDNNWFKSTNPEMIEHVTDLEDDLNALFPPEDIKELEEDESWMWEAYDIDDPCSICLAPVSSRPLIALASAPGSGIHRIRYSLEQATGIYTGSIYKDKRLFYGGFQAEFMDYTYKNTLVVTSHDRSDKATNDFKKAILVMRNPFDVILTELYRIYGVNGTALRTAEDITRYSDWQDLVLHRLNWWENVPNVWLSSEKPLLIIHYEDFVRQPIGTIRKMVRFLDLSLNDQRIECVEKNLQKHIPVLDIDDVSDDFKRSVFEAFDEEMVSRISNRLSKVSRNLRDNGHDEIVKREMYVS